MLPKKKHRESIILSKYINIIKKDGHNRKMSLLKICRLWNFSLWQFCRCIYYVLYINIYIFCVFRYGFETCKWNTNKKIVYRKNNNNIRMKNINKQQTYFMKFLWFLNLSTLALKASTCLYYRIILVCNKVNREMLLKKCNYNKNIKIKL